MLFHFTLCKFLTRKILLNLYPPPSPLRWLRSHQEVILKGYISSVQSLSGVKLCNPTDCSTPSFPVHHPTPGACSNSCPSNRWSHPNISTSVIPFSSHLQFSPASRSFPTGQFFKSGGQSIGSSASVPPMNIQDWFPLGWTSWISLQSKGLSRVFSNTTVPKHKFFSAQLSL